MDLRTWLLDELDDATTRLRGQVLHLVPPERRLERPGGGNSIAWSLLHVARHADLALTVVTGGEPAVRRGGDGLDEGQQDVPLDPESPAAYALDVLARARELLATLDAAALDTVPDTATALEASDVPRDRYDWLYAMWSDRPVAFFVRWPLIGHVNNHVGEMIANRNRMGLSPH